MTGKCQGEDTRSFRRNGCLAGKAPGAKIVEDVRRYYTAKVPMNRGCFPKDVLRAIFYCVERKYEPGQAILVTGGQVMLK